MRPRVLLALLAIPLFAACERPSVLVLGLDGADWRVMDPLMREGYLPTMRELVEDGVRGEQDCTPALPSLACFCPPVWMSLFTGRPAADHGIIVDTQSPDERRVKAIWDVLHDYGGTATAASLHNLWPPEPDLDVVLTTPGVDFVADQRFSRWPVGLPITAFVEDSRTKPVDLFFRLHLLPYSGDRPPVWSPIARDRVTMEALRRLLRRERTDLTVVLLHSTDKVGHVLWDTVQKVPGTPLNETALLRDAATWSGPVSAPGPWGWGTLVAPYLEIDHWLGTLLADFPFDYVVLVSDHGMERRRGPGLAGDHGPTAVEAHRGILAIHGPGVKRGADIGLVGVNDLAPTLAVLLRLPVADDLPGRVLDEAFEGPPRIFHVPSWEQPLPDRWRKVLRLHRDQHQ